jgi:hypothetical protein
VTGEITEVAPAPAPVLPTLDMPWIKKNDPKWTRTGGDTLKLMEIGWD